MAHNTDQTYKWIYPVTPSFIELFAKDNFDESFSEGIFV